MRSLSLFDLLIVLGVVALLLFAASREFGRYGSKTLAPTPAATAQETH